MCNNEKCMGYVSGRIGFDMWGWIWSLDL
jgi:hypothetical protein